MKLPRRFYLHTIAHLQLQKTLWDKTNAANTLRGELTYWLLLTVVEFALAKEWTIARAKYTLDEAKLALYNWWL